MDSLSALAGWLSGLGFIKEVGHVCQCMLLEDMVNCFVQRVVRCLTALSEYFSTSFVLSLEYQLSRRNLLDGW